MAFSIVSRGLLRTSREFLERNMSAGTVTLLHNVVDVDTQRAQLGVSPQQQQHQQQRLISSFVGSPILLRTVSTNELLQKTNQSGALDASRQYSKKHAQLSSKRDEESESDTDSDDEFERNRRKLQSKRSERGDSEFWRRKMRTLHRILDINRDGVISFDDFNLLAKRFTDLGHLSSELSAEFLDVLKQTWEEQFGEITVYNLVTAEQFLTDLHHRLNDKRMAKRIGRFLPYLFKAVDFDHTGHLDLEQYKMFFRCLGLSDEDAAISFAVIDKNGDGQVSLKEFVHLGRQYFLTEDETKISKMFWGPLIDH